MKSVTHLHFHSEYSFLDSLIRIEQLPELCEKKSIRALALTDHGNVDGTIKFYQALGKTKTVPLLGCELYVVDDLSKKEDKKRYHLTVIAKNRRGFSSLMRCLTVANLEGFYYRPRTGWSYVVEHLEDVILMTACTDGPLSHPRSDEIITRLAEKFGDDFYIEQILLPDFDPQVVRNKLAATVAAERGLKMAFTTDVHYAEKDDWRDREIQRVMSHREKIADLHQLDNVGTKSLWLKTYDEMTIGLKAFGLEDREAAMVKVWDEIVDKCSFKLEQLSVTVPLAYEEAKDDPPEYLRQLCRTALASNDNLKDNEAACVRMEHELDEIIELGFAEYFLLVQDMVLQARERGIQDGTGRGSVGGSIVAYLMGITGVNPLDYGLAFERFISPGRHDLPDIDLDFEDVKRDGILKYMSQKYGEHNVAQVSTFSTSHGRGAVRDVSRVYDVPLAEVDAVAKQIVIRSGGDMRADLTLEDTVTLFENSKEFATKYPHVISTAKKLEGIVKGRGVHAAGLVVDTSDLFSGEKCVLLKDKDGDLVINWDKYDLEYMGMMKLDVLGLKTLNVLHRIHDLVLERHGVDIDWKAIPLNGDKAVYDAFCAGEAIGVFQYGTAGMQQYLRQFLPKNFNDLVQINALWRPGTLRSGAVSEFIEYRTGKKKPNYINKVLESILKETHGIVLYQEQIMYVLNQIGNIPWRTADIIRKVVSKSEGQEKFELFRKEFMDGVRELKSLPEKDAEKIFSLMKFHGCLTGDTKIYRCSSNQYKPSEMTLKEAYVRPYNAYGAGINILSMSADGFVRYNAIKSVTKTGIKPVYMVRTASGKRIKATAEHVFLVNDKWLKVSEFGVGDWIRVTDRELPDRSKATIGRGPFGKDSPHKHKGEGPTNERRIRRAELQKKYGDQCQLCDSGRFVEMHHIDGDTCNNSEENTLWLCRRHHRSHTDRRLFKRFRVGYYSYNDKVVSIDMIGNRETYDVEMEGEPANFIADNFVSHNSYSFNKSHSVEYSMLGLWTMWAKVHYPEEFYCASLCRGDDEDLSQLLSDASRRGFSVNSPDINLSQSSWMVEGTKAVRAGFDAIKGISLTTSEAIVKAREAAGGRFERFEQFYDAVPKRSVNILKIRQLLLAGAFDSLLSKVKRNKMYLFIEHEKWVSSDDTELATISDLDAEGLVIDLSEVFNYELSSNYYAYNQKLIALLSSKLNIVKLDIVKGTSREHRGEEKKIRYFVGKFDSIKYGYRARVEKVGDVESKGFSGDLGGVYGILRDDTWSSYASFSGKLYRRPEIKGRVEECSGKPLLLRVDELPWGVANLFITDLFFMEDIRAGILAPTLELGGVLQQDNDNTVAKALAAELSQCEACLGRASCKRPTPFSLGALNAMIVGEAPGKDEEEQGLPFVGRSGQTLWTSLERHQACREMFHVTNVLKCRPKDNIYDTKAGDICRTIWLAGEIEAVQPRIILALGKQATQGLLNDPKASIMEKNATAEWSERYGAWIVFGLHPASVLYSPENKAGFDAAIDVFAALCTRLL